MKKEFLIFISCMLFTSISYANNEILNDNEEQLEVDNYNTADPLEGFNRKIFVFNESVDSNVLKPIAYTYKSITPNVAQEGVSNFFGNLGDVGNIANNVLQGNFKKGVDSFLRVVFNSTFGLGGLIDMSTKFGIEKHDTNFGTTLGTWGVGEGAYVVLPFFGPSNVRDGLGKVVDSKLDLVLNHKPINERNSLLAARVISDRAELLTAEEVFNDMIIDKYLQLKDAYTQKRKSEIADAKSK